MREHQIVITLKPEQFVAVQRLARDAGAKSMGIFVRSKLLAALGIEGSASQSTAGGKDIAPAVAELKRLHTELKGFVAESLALYDLDQEAISSADSFLPANTDSLDASSPSPSDELEQLADRTFAISPRLGAVHIDAEAQTEERDPLSDLLADVSIPEGAAAGEEDDTFQVPLAIRERRRQMAETNLDGESLESIARASEATNDAAATNTTQAQQPAVEEDLQQRQRHSRHTRAASDENSSAGEKSAQDSQDKTNEQKGQDPLPPISGSPPPKRKKT